MLIFPSSSLYGLRTLGAGIPGAVDTVAIVLSAPVDTDFETGLADCVMVFVDCEEEVDRRCWRDWW